MNCWGAVGSRAWQSPLSLPFGKHTVHFTQPFGCNAHEVGQIFRGDFRDEFRLGFPKVFQKLNRGMRYHIVPDLNRKDKRFDTIFPIEPIKGRKAVGPIFDFTSANLTNHRTFEGAYFVFGVFVQEIAVETNGHV